MFTNSGRSIFWECINDTKYQKTAIKSAVFWFNQDIYVLNAGVDLLSPKRVSSAQEGLTSEFGMGSGVALLP